MLSKKSKRRFGTFEESKTKDAVDSKIFTNSEPPNKIIRVSSTRNNKNLHSTYDALNSMSSPSTSRDSVKMVTCVLLNNFHLEVPFDVMTHCETFNEAQKFSNYINNPNLFEMKLIDVDAFRKIIEYIQKTKDKSISHEKINTVINQRGFLKFSDYEEKFFNELSVPELCQLLEASNYLQAKRFYTCGCQNAALRLQGKTSEEIRNEWTFK